MTDYQVSDESLERWVSRFGLKRQATRQLWKAIQREFLEQNTSMTVRQMFYRMSSTGQVAKTENGYRQVQYALSEMRQAGAIKYSWIADNTRWVRQQKTYSSLDDMLRESRQLYRRALWDSQPDYVEIWLEKDALAGVIVDVTGEYDVPLYVTRGYPSLSYLYDAAESLKAIKKPIYVYHFGDFDASGKDAARSIRDGLARFGARFHFHEVAVTEGQITSMNLQTRPAKGSDPRAARWGKVAVELDAIPPATLRQMVAATIEQHIDQVALARLRNVEAGERATLDRWISSILN